MQSKIEPHYRVSLRITHPSIRADEISRQLDLPADISWSSGDERRTPKGSLLKGTRKESYFCIQFPAVNSSLEQSILSAISLLMKSKDQLLRIRSTGGQLEFFVSWFKESNGGFTLDLELLTLLAALNINLALDIYVHPTK